MQLTEKINSPMQNTRWLTDSTKAHSQASLKRKGPNTKSGLRDCLESQSSVRAYT